MTTIRAYFQDAYRQLFSARILSITPATAEKAIDVILDQTFFYPTSGGQPHDLGSVGDLPVLDVFVEPSTGAIVHRLGGNEKSFRIGQVIDGQIDWQRRLDHMQQHTGQHILSQAFIEVANAETVGFHVGSGACTIDLAVSAPAEEAIRQAETLANQIIWDDRPVRAYFVTHTEAQMLPLRKRPQVDEDRLRLVEIDRFDLNACGGTHVSRTGEVGFIKISRMEKRKKKIRVEFRCGRWAFNHYEQLLNVSTQLTTEFTTAFDALPQVLIKLRSERRQLQKELRTAQKELLAGRAAVLARSFVHDPEREVAILVRCVDAGIDAEALPQLAGELAGQPGRAVFLGHPGGRLVMRKSADVPGDLGTLLRSALDPKTENSGGGGPHFAQGHLQHASGDRLLAFLTDVSNRLLAEIRDEAPPSTVIGN